MYTCRHSFIQVPRGWRIWSVRVWEARLILFMSENKKEKNRNQEERTEEKQERRDKQVEEYGQLTLEDGEAKIHLLNIIGEIEGHECLPSNSKTTKYEHVIPQLAALEDSKTIQGLLVLINTVGASGKGEIE